MSYVKETEEELEARNNYYSYRRGWIDAAKATSMSDVDTSPAYIEGYNHGYKARHEAMLKAKHFYGAKLSEIRAI